MEHNHHHDHHEHHHDHHEHHVADEALEGVAGGTFAFREFFCPICNESSIIDTRVPYQGQLICQKCKDKLESGDANVAAAAASAKAKAL